MGARGVVEGVLAVSILTAIAGCNLEPEAEVTSGDAGSPGWQRLVDYYRLRLPAGHGPVAWIQTRDIGTNELYIRVHIRDAEAVVALLGSHGMRLHPSSPYSGGCAEALPRSSGWAEEMPAAVLDWRPRAGSPSRCGHGEFTYRHLVYRADGLVVRVNGPGQLVYLHLSQAS